MEGPKVVPSGEQNTKYKNRVLYPPRGFTGVVVVQKPIFLFFFIFLFRQGTEPFHLYKNLSEFCTSPSS